MKKYRVTVNGTVYEVELEELTGSAPVSAPAAPAAAPAPAASAAPAAGEQICAPMPGNILAVNVTAGQAVKKGDVLMVLEAMKMENEIMCPRDGVVASVNTFLSLQTIKIMLMGVVAFSFGTAGGVLLAKFMNLFLKEKINPLIGSAGVSAVPMAARVSQMVGQKYNPGNFLLMHAMGPNVAGVIGSAIAAGVLISLYG